MWINLSVMNIRTKAVNGLPYLTKHANAYISGNVTGMVDLGTHIMFICEVTESVRAF